MARRLTARPVPAWVGDLPVFERTLPNGLKAVVLPRRNAPVVVTDLYYPVGSVHEPAGRTGLAHFVEHMLFKGTKRFPKGQIDRLAFLAGGHSNAETAEDVTHYWFSFPAARWELALAVEADRMRGAIFNPAEVEAERYVIAEERARELDSPLGRLDQTHLAVSYLVHPYRNPILGWPEDLLRTNRDDLRDFYSSHYRPDGAVLVVVGHLDPEPALDLIEAQLGAIPRGRTARIPPPAIEPRQVGRRDFTLEEADAVARGLFGWHTVPRGHADLPALDVLSDLLTFGKRSRLCDRLVERGRLATWVESSHESAHLAGQFLIQVEAAPGIDLKRIETEIREQIDRLAEDGPTREELLRSRNRLQAAWRWEQEDLAGLASGLGHGALWGDWRAWQSEHRAAEAVDADAIRRVASTYLFENGLTLGWSVPRSPRGSLYLPETRRLSATLRPGSPPGPEAPIDVAIPVGPSVLAEYRPERSLLPNGLRVLTETRPGSGTAALELHVDAGLLREAKPGVAFLTARLREEGTLTRSAEALAEAIEDVGGTLEVGATGVSCRVRAEDLALAVELMADLALRPAFPADALAWTVRRMAAELQGDLDEPSFQAELLFRRLVYGAHPYGRDARGTARHLAAISLADIKSHHDRLFAADNAFVVAVGDFDPREFRELLKQHFRSWAPRQGPVGRVPQPVVSGRPRVRKVAHRGEQVHVLLGHIGVARDHSDFHALAVLDHILGSGPGFCDRLSRILRDELGLAYAVGGGMTDSADVVPGLFRIYVGTAADQVARAVTAAKEQVRAMSRGEFSDEEVNRARQYLAGSWVFDFQTVSQRAERLVELERWGLPLDEPIKLPERISRITPRRVRAAARRHIHPSELSRVEYGPIAKRR
jgi:zinc protease